MYILGNGNHYITAKDKDIKNHKCLTPLKENAIQFNTKEEATNILNQLVKIRKKHPSIVVINLDEVKDTGIITKKSMMPNFEDRTKSDDVTYKSVVGLSKKLVKKISKKDKLEKERGKYDRLVVDYVHKIELNTLSKKEVYELYEEMHEMLQKRRKVKDELEEVYTILTHVDFNKLDGLLTYYENKENRVYKNRELDGYIGN